MKKKIVLLGIGIFLFSSCGFSKEEVRSLGTFHGISVAGAFKVILKKTEKNQITIECDNENEFSKIKTEVENGILKVDIKKRFTTNSNIKMVIEYSGEIDFIDMSGASIVKGESVFKSQSMKLDVSGAGEVTLSIECENLTVDLSGASTLSVSGKTIKQSIDASGAVSYEALDLECDITSIESSGACSTSVVARKELKADCSGAGSVRYKGSPEKLWVESSGAGSIKKLD